jgi:hypothetical protein
MPLIECPDCGRATSSAAVSCPNCGRPIAAANHDGSGRQPWARHRKQFSQWQPARVRHRAGYSALVSVLILSFATVLLAFGNPSEDDLAQWLTDRLAARGTDIVFARTQGWLAAKTFTQTNFFVFSIYRCRIDDDSSIPTLLGLAKNFVRLPRREHGTKGPSNQCVAYEGGRTATSRP